MNIAGVVKVAYSKALAENSRLRGDWENHQRDADRAKEHLDRSNDGIVELQREAAALGIDLSDESILRLAIPASSV